MSYTESAARRMTSLGFDARPYPAGIHMCFIFDDEDERRHVLAKYIQSGLQEREQVAYFVDTMSPDELTQHLRRLGVEIPKNAEDRQCLISTAESTYCPDGTFRVERMLDTLEHAYEHCCSAGFDGLRVTGEMNWALRGYPGTDRLIEYESRVNQVLRKVPVTAICQYDARLFDGATLYNLLKVHPMMIVHGQVVSNPYYVDATQESAAE
jgi:MEDS: MEthanogen/methylotroph, DcmR Sensory domain